MFSVGVGKDPADHPEQVHGALVRAVAPEHLLKDGMGKFALAGPTQSAEDAQKELEGLLRKVVMVEIKDGRRIVGSVNCIDPQGNLIVEVRAWLRQCAPPPPPPPCWGLPTSPRPRARSTPWSTAAPGTRSRRGRWAWCSFPTTVACASASPRTHRIGRVAPDSNLAAVSPRPRESLGVLPRKRRQLCRPPLLQQVLAQHAQLVQQLPRVLLRAARMPMPGS